VADDAVSDAPNGSKRYVVTVMTGATGFSLILLRSVIGRFGGPSWDGGIRGGHSTVGN
jgi:hypothetical protein